MKAEDINVKNFEEKVMPEPMSGCWLWTACMNRSDGYGLFFVKTAKFPAHRVSYLLFMGHIPDGLFVLHHCIRGARNPFLKQ